jgi:amphi-Trp domain-containing protein
MVKSEVKIEKRMKLEEAVRYLSELLGKAGKGGFSLQEDEVSVTLEPKSEVMVKVKAKRKKGREKLSFSMSWLMGEQLSLEDGAIASPAVIRADEEAT